MSTGNPENYMIRCNLVEVAVNHFLGLGIAPRLLIDGLSTDIETITNPNNWIPVDDWYHLLDNCQNAFPFLTLADWERIAFKIKESQGSDLFKTVLFLLGPRKFYKFAPQLTDKMNSYQTMKTLAVGRGRADIVFEIVPEVADRASGLFTHWTSGMLAAVPAEAYGLDTARCTILYSQAKLKNVVTRLYRKFKLTYALRDGQVWVADKPVGRRIRLIEETVKGELYFTGNYEFEKPFNALLLTEDIVVEGKKILSAQEIFDAPYSRVVCEWKAVPFWQRFFKALFRSRQAKVNYVATLEEQSRLAERRYFESEQLRHSESRINHELRLALEELGYVKSKLESHSRQLENKIQERTDQLITVQNKLIEQEKILNETYIAGGIAHEIRNALGAAKLRLYKISETGEIERAMAALERLVDIFKQEVDTSEPVSGEIIDCIRELYDIQLRLRETLEIVTASTERGLQISNRVMTYSKLHHEEIQQSADIERIVGQIYSLNSDIMKDSNVELVMGVDGIRTVKMDANHVHCILNNLILNGKDAIQDKDSVGGCVEVNISGRRNRFIIKVRDNGVGIDESEYENIFNPFHSTKPSASLGLGLSECRKIANFYNGTIDVESTPGLGSIFTVELPVKVNEL